MFCLMLLFCFAVPAFAETVAKSPVAPVYDFAVILASLISFVFDQFFRLFNFIEDGLISLRNGGSDIPIFGSIYRAMKYADMIDYTIPQGIEGQDNFLLRTICDVGIRLMESFKKLLSYMEMNIQNGYFPGLVRNFMEYLDIELDKYAFYKAWRGFVNALPSSWLSDILVSVFK